LTDFYKERLRRGIEGSPFSEDFVIHLAGPLEFESAFGEVETRGDASGRIAARGLFNSGVERDAARETTKPAPRVVLYAAPRLLPRDTVVTVRGEEFRARKMESDASLGFVIHLN
jgi:hypothetical protein